MRIADVLGPAAACAPAIATGHCAHDGGKRTAHQTMAVCLATNGVEVERPVADVGPRTLATEDLPPEAFAVRSRGLR